MKLLSNLNNNAKITSFLFVLLLIVLVAMPPQAQASALTKIAREASAFRPGRDSAPRKARSDAG